MTPARSQRGSFIQYHHDELDMYVGNVFDLTPDHLGPVDAIYDRAALVALPEEMRQRYTRNLRALNGTDPQLLICFSYEQAAMPGPPFSITEAEVHAHYAASYAIENLETKSLSLKGQVPAKETAWFLSPHP